VIPIALLAAALSSASAAEPTAPIRRFALVVGANDGGPSRTLLRYAQADAASFLDVLRDLGGVASADAVLLAEPDVRSLDAAFDTLRARVAAAGNARTEVVFYYSGHSDETGLLLRGAHFPYPTVRAELEATQADVRIAVLDSCSSGAMNRTKGGTVVPPFLVDESSAVRGHAYLTSASADEAAQESDRILGSFFTHALVTGLRGAADMTGDGRVSLSEAHTFAYQETLSQTQGTRYGAQHATHDIHIQGTGDLVLTDLSVVDAGIILVPDLAGRLVVRDSSGRLVVEVNKQAGRSLELGLGEGRYRLGLERDGASYEARVWLAPGQRPQVGLDRFERTALIATTARGDQEQRRVPFAVTIWPGFPDLRNKRVGSALVFGGTTTGELRGVALGLGWVRSLDTVSGAQASVGFNLADQDMRGAQVTVGANVARREVNGAQLSAGGNIAAGAVRGAQIATGINVAGGPLRGAQISAGVNVAPAASRGAQITSGINVAGNDFHGAQVGIINLGRDLSGSQVGLLNVARDVSGSQVGLINVSRSTSGASVALLPVVQKGDAHLEVWSSDSIPANLSFQFGSKHTFALVAAGVDPVTGLGYTGAGFGVHVQRRESPELEGDRDGRTWAEIDAVAGTPWKRTRPVGEALYVHGRVSVGFEVADRFSPQVGVQVGVLSDYVDENFVVRGLFLPDGGTSGFQTVVWPGVFAGVQF
jgi:hypothetical protein